MIKIKTKQDILHAIEFYNLNYRWAISDLRIKQLKQLLKSQNEKTTQKTKNKRD